METLHEHLLSLINDSLTAPRNTFASPAAGCSGRQRSAFCCAVTLRPWLKSAGWL